MSEGIYPRHLWFNGQIVPWEAATLHATSTIWSGISAVFEGVRAYWNPISGEMHIFRLHEHLTRLKQSMRLNRMEMPHEAIDLMEGLPELIRRNGIQEDTYIRIIAFPSERRMASRADEEVMNLLADTAPLASRLADDRAAHLMVSTFTKISDAIMSPLVKSIANYRNSERAMQEARLAGYDGTILLNRLGEVAEGAWSNVFMVRNGVLITPDLGSDLLAGVTRDTMIHLARTELGIPVEERRISRTELYLADEVFLCGTALEMQVVASIDRFQIGDGTLGPVARKLRSLYSAAVRGENDDYAHWRSTAPTMQAAY
jgi:branched-chain amino acid aminotransferase